MLGRSRCRRSRVTLLFMSLIILTGLVYALLNISTNSSASHRQRLKQHGGGDGQLANVINNRSSSGQRPTSIASVSFVRQFNTQEKTESFANGENATEDDSQADTGMDEDGKVYSRAGNGSQAGLTLTNDHDSYNKKALLSQRRPRDAPNIWVP